jgi:hypothetical protein
VCGRTVCFPCPSRVLRSRRSGQALDGQCTDCPSAMQRDCKKTETPQETRVSMKNLTDYFLRGLTVSLTVPLGLRTTVDCFTKRPVVADLPLFPAIITSLVRWNEGSRTLRCDSSHRVYRVRRVVVTRTITRIGLRTIVRVRMILVVTAIRHLPPETVICTLGLVI